MDLVREHLVQAHHHPVELSSPVDQLLVEEVPPSFPVVQRHLQLAEPFSLVDRHLHPQVLHVLHQPQHQLQ